MTCNSWGWHTIIDGAECELELMKDKDNIQNCVNEILEKTKMHPMGPTVFEYAESTEDHIEVAGYTAVQIITTSCLVMHLAEHSRSIYFDFFSCKPYDKEVVKELVTKYFKCKSIREIYLSRKA
jgi:S-adenosylmethionine/arginine decarboxylase-like enzyme